MISSERKIKWNHLQIYGSHSLCSSLLSRTLPCEFYGYIYIIWIYILYMWIYTLFLKEKIFVFQIQLKFINPLKNLRRLGIKMVTDIFLDWESYQFRTEEIDAVFHGAVWPQVNLDFCIVPWCYLLVPLLLLHLHSSYPDLNACPGLFFYIEPFFISESFRTLFFASPTT